MTIEQGRMSGWTRSSYSAGNGACVEVRSPGRDLLAVRDSKNPAGPRLGFPGLSWTAFVGSLEGREFDRR